MYILKNYPQMSETYIKTEIEAVGERCEIAVLATKKANLPSKNHVPFELVEDMSAIREAIEEFHPDVLHSHWLHSLKILRIQSGRIRLIPFGRMIIRRLIFCPLFVHFVYRLKFAGLCR